MSAPYYVIAQLDVKDLPQYSAEYAVGGRVEAGIRDAHVATLHAMAAEHHRLERITLGRGCASRSVRELVRRETFTPAVQGKLRSSALVDLASGKLRHARRQRHAERGWARSIRGG